MPREDVRSFSLTSCGGEKGHCPTITFRGGDGMYILTDDFGGSVRFTEEQTEMLCVTLAAFFKKPTADNVEKE